MKKVISFIMVLSMLLSYAVTVSAADTTVMLLGTDITTKGNWVGTYGESGYQIFYGDTDETSGRDNTAKNIVSLPSYTSLTTMYTGLSYNVNQNPSEDERALYMPEGDGYVVRAITPYIYNKNGYTINITDNQMHIVSFYITDFTTDNDKLYYKLMTSDGEVIKTADFSYSEGTYISVAANTTFKFEVGTYKYDDTLAINAIFFDEFSTNSSGTFSATKGSAARSATLTWQASFESVNIYRKTSSDSNYTLIAQGATGTSYTDTDLDANTTYNYQIIGKVGSSFCDPLFADYVTETYDSTNLTVLTDTTIDVGEFGEENNIQAKLTNSSGAALSGVTVTAQLEGDFDYLTDSEKIVATATTDSSGVVAIEYKAVYYGEYKIKLVSAHDDTNNYASAQADILINFPTGPNDNVPYLSKISEEIAPGEVFNVYGHGIKGNVKMALAVADGAVSQTPPEDSFEIQITQVDQSKWGNYVTAILPSSLTAGMYDVWVKNDYGWSAPIRLNAPVALFMDEYEIAAGLDVRLIGRNFDAAQYSGTGTVGVRLKNSNGTTYPAIVKEANRVMAMFTIDSSVPKGTYNVEVNVSSNNDWEELQSGQTLTVLDSVYDPLGLGVPWANKFTTTEYDYTKQSYTSIYGGGPGKTTDQSSLVSAVISLIQSNGGGILYFPEGDYIINDLALRSGVIIKGAGKDNTRFIINKTDAERNAKYRYYLHSDAKTNGLTGISDLTIYTEDASYIPSESFIVCGGSGDNCSNIFFNNVDIDVDPENAKLGSAISIGGINERFLIQNCNFDGVPTSGYVKKYGKFLNNTFNFTCEFPSLFAEYSTLYNNKAINPQVASGTVDVNENIHGFSIKGNAYFAENEIILGMHPGRQGAGEIVLMEMVEHYTYGDVINATSDSVRVTNLDKYVTADGGLSLPVPIHNELSILITGGYGVGQSRKIVGTSGDDTLILDRPWDVIPDASSEYSIGVTFENTTVYNNTAEKCEANIAFYSNCINCVALENELDETGGIGVNAFHIEGQNRVRPSYFIRIEDNTLTNNLTSNVYNGLGATGYIGGGEDLQLAGIEIKDNYISNVSDDHMYHDEIATRLRLLATYANYDYNALGNIIDSNTYVGFDTPILLERVSGVILNDNVFTDCGTTVTNKNAINVLDISGLDGVILGQKTLEYQEIDYSNVLLNNEINLTFNNTISNVNDGDIVLKNSSNEKIPFSVEYNGKSITLSVLNRLERGQYTLTLSSSLTSSNGCVLENPQSINMNLIDNIVLSLDFLGADKDSSLTSKGVRDVAGVLNTTITTDADINYGKFQNVNGKTTAYVDFETGSNDYIGVQLGEDIGYDSSTGAHTVSVEFWANINDVASVKDSTKVFAARNNNANALWMEIVRNSENRFGVFPVNCSNLYLGDFSYDLTEKNVINTWAHYVITQSRTSDGTYALNVYVNGTLYKSESTTYATALSGIDEFRLASYEYNNANIDFKLASFNVYDTILDAATVANNYEATKSNFDMYPIYFDEAQTMTYSDSTITYNKSNVVNNTANPVTAKLIFAAYDSSNNLTDLIIKDVTVSANGGLSSDVTITDATDVAILTGASEVKTLLWDTLNGMKPITNSSSVSLS